jgi:hypothetical protein
MDVSVVNLRDEFECIGEVDLRVFDPSIITFRGKAEGSDTLFRRGKAGWLSLYGIPSSMVPLSNQRPAAQG